MHDYTPALCSSRLHLESRPLKISRVNAAALYYLFAILYYLLVISLESMVGSSNGTYNRMIGTDTVHPGPGLLQ